MQAVPPPVRLLGQTRRRRDRTGTAAHAKAAELGGVQVGSYRGYTGCDDNAVAKATHDPSVRALIPP